MMSRKTSQPEENEPKVFGASEERQVRTVPEDDDDFYLDEIYEDDYERRRQHAHRAEFALDGEFRHYDFWD